MDVPYWFICLVFFMLVSFCFLINVLIFYILPTKIKSKIVKWIYEV